MSTLGLEAHDMDEDDHFLPFPPCLHGHIQTTKRQRPLVHWLRNGSPVSRICCPLRIQASVSRNYTKTEAKAKISEAGNSPWQSCLFLPASSEAGVLDQRGIREFCFC